MPRKGGRSRKAISVMFMTFIAISILTAVFLTMYLYLIRSQTSATDVERLYSEASNEDLKVYIDRLADGGNGEIIIENVGGIGVTVKYVVELDWSDKTAKLCNVDQFLPVNSSLVIKLSEVNGECDNPISPDGDLYILTERGNMFKAVRGGASFELEVSPRIATLESGGSLPVTLTLKAILLETPSDGRVLIISDTSGCRMNETKVIIAGRNATTMTVVTSISQWFFLIIPYYGTLTAVASPTTTTIILEQRFIDEPTPITLTLSTRTTTTITTLVTLTARNITPWISGSECYVWFRVLNATSGSRLAEGGLQVIAGGTTMTTTTTTSTTTTGTTTTETTTTTTTTTTGKSFSLSLNPDEIRIPVGGTGLVRVTVRAEKPDYEGRVRLSVENPPKGITFKFDPKTVSVSPENPGESTLTIRVGKKVIPDEYEVQIVGVDTDTNERSEPAVLTIRVERLTPPPTIPLPAPE